MVNKILQIENEKSRWHLLLFYMVAAFLFSLAVRQIYIEAVVDVKEFYHNGVLMINTNDGYSWAEGARDILAGFHQQNDLSPIDYPISKLTAYLSKYLGIPLDTLIFYLPGILGSLLAVPLVLIGAELGSAFLGFLAALLAPIAWSYYHRTMYGYYDTDMLIIVLPTFAIWGVVRAFRTKSFRDFWIAPLFLMMGIAWHNGLFSVANGIFVMALIYVLLFDRDKRNFLFLALLLLPVLNVPFWLKVAALFIATPLFFKFETKLEANLKYFLIVVVLLYAIFGGYEWILKVINSGYFTRSSTVDEEGLKFFGVINTVREAGHISFDTLVHRISGSYIGFFVGATGYLLLMVRYPSMLVSLPMVALGLYAIWGGLRFTIFAVPFFALGDAYLILLIANYLKKFFVDDRVAKALYYLFGLVAMAGIVYPNVTHAQKYIMPTVMNEPEIKIIEELGKIAKRNDYVLTWWDYGYPIRYYADVKTLIDGGKHSGDVNFPVSFALATASQRASYNMAILDVYFTEKFYNEKVEGKTYIEAMMEKYGFRDPNKFLQFLNNPIDLPKVKEDIYYFLPYRMLKIFPTVAKFSQIDLTTGKPLKEHFYFIAEQYQKQGNQIFLGRGISILLDRGALKIAGQLVPIKHYTAILHKADGSVDVKEQLVSMQGLDVIQVPAYHLFLVVSNDFYNSTYFQLFLFHKYDKELFEPVTLSPYVAIYKVKK